MFDSFFPPPPEMNTSRIESSFSCSGGYQRVAFGVPTPLALCLTAPLSAVGILLNAFVWALLLCQKQLSNQDLYVMTLSFFGMVMAGPCLILFAYGNMKFCFDLPQIVSDLRILLVQVSAGVSIWLVVLIGIDRLLMVRFKLQYAVRVTKTKTKTCILALAFTYTFLCGLITFSPYIFDAYPTGPFSVHPRHIMIAAHIESPTDFSHVANIVRMGTDRMLPWILCTCTYVAIFVIRNRQRRRVLARGLSPTFLQQLSCTLFVTAPNNASSVLRRRKDTAQLYKRSRNLVIGITASLLLCLIPETVFDASLYIFQKSLRVGAWQLFGLVWYLQTIVNPVIYITSMPNLRSTAEMILKGFSSRVTEPVLVKFFKVSN